MTYQAGYISSIGKIALFFTEIQVDTVGFF
jgi:hypothetical protein